MSAIDWHERKPILSLRLHAFVVVLPLEIDDQCPDCVVATTFSRVPIVDAACKYENNNLKKTEYSVRSSAMASRAREQRHVFPSRFWSCRCHLHSIRQNDSFSLTSFFSLFIRHRSLKKKRHQYWFLFCCQLTLYLPKTKKRKKTLVLCVSHARTSTGIR